MRARTFIAAAALACAGALAAPAAEAAKAPPTGEGTGGFRLTQVGTFEQPIHADNAPGTKSTLYVTEQEGRIRVLNGSTILPVPFLDVSDMVQCCGEEGLFSIAFHPEYRENRLFYVYFTNNAGDQVVMEFQRSKKRKFLAERSSARQVLTVPHPTFANHNGGQIRFGPDGLLYLATGDGGSGGDPFNNAQNTESLLGKMLRIDPRKTKRKKRGFTPYAIPKDNPFVGKPGRDEIYSTGLRNPFRFSFDAANGALSLGDVGQGCLEELDYLPRGAARGANFGWSRFEGTSLFDASRTAANPVPPVHQYDNAGNDPSCARLNNGFEGFSVMAGYVVRDPRLAAQYGRLLYTDAGNDQIRSLIPFRGGSADEQFTGIDLPGEGLPFGFAEGFQSQLFVISGNGPIYRLDP